jgi:hypothetical protein
LIPTGTAPRTVLPPTPTPTLAGESSDEQGVAPAQASMDSDTTNGGKTDV